jgi:hypothetical protein
VPSLEGMTSEPLPNTGTLPVAATAVPTPPHASSGGAGASYAPAGGTGSSYAPAGAYADAKNLSVISLILGLASLLLGQTFLVPIAAIVVGVLGYRREPAGRALAVWGIVLGALMAFGWLVVAVIGLALAGPFFLVGLF